MATILIAANNTKHRTSLATMLSYSGHQLLEASVGAEVLERTRIARPDLVIADLHMARQDGYDLVRQLRGDAVHKQPHLILFTTTCFDQISRQIAREYGIEYLIDQHASPKDLLCAVASAIKSNLAAPALDAAARLPEADMNVQMRWLANTLATKVDELAEAHERMAALHELTQRMAAERDPASVLQLCCDAARIMIGAQYAAIIISPDAQHAVDRFHTSMTGKPMIQLGEQLEYAGPTSWQSVNYQPRPLCYTDVACEGQDLPPKLAGRAFLRVPIVSANHRYGILYLTEKLDGPAFTAADQQLAVTLAAQVAIAYENVLLFEQVQSGAAGLRSLTQQLVHAQEDERRHIARELHDEIGQSLTAALLNLQTLAELPQLAVLPARLEDSMKLIERVLQQVRAIALDLRPALLDELGLAPALHWLAHRQAERAGFSVQMYMDHIERSLPAELDSTCFRIVQEALTNITRYAQATHVAIELRQEDDTLYLSIHDDGVGFDVALAQQRAGRGQSLGLLGMLDRVELLGGQVDIVSELGRGATIDVRLPLLAREAPMPHA